MEVCMSIICLRQMPRIYHFKVVIRQYYLLFTNNLLHTLKPTRLLLLTFRPTDLLFVFVVQNTDYRYSSSFIFAQILN